MSSDQNFLWVEKYRPKTIDECILPENLKLPFQSYTKTQNIPNLILTGTPGVGKTTVARAMCEEAGIDYILINGSVESGIDTLRVKVMGFASSISLMGGRKVIIVDEADKLSNAAQMGFRGVIEEVSDNCTFIFTCNYVNRIEDAIHSRCAVINFSLQAEDKKKMAAAFFKRITQILDIEKISFEKEAIANLIMKHFPDYRRVLNELQRYSAKGVIDLGILSQISNGNMKALMELLKKKDFYGLRKWVGENGDVDVVSLMTDIYNSLENIVQAKSMPFAVVLLAKYQYQSAFVVDQQINLMAFLTELIAECEFVN